MIIGRILRRLILHGELHYLASFVIAGALGLAALLAGRDLRHDRRRALAVYCLLTGFAVVTMFTVSLLVPSVAAPGLLERVALSSDRSGWWLTLSG